METNQTVADGVAAPAPWRRTRPIWLVVLLSIATFGLYPYWWFYATWRELKLEVDDPRMRPVWHALAIALVPIYNYFRFYAHMDLLSMRRRYDAATLRALSRRGALRVLAPGPTVPSSGKPSPWFCLVDRPNQLK